MAICTKLSGETFTSLQKSLPNSEKVKQEMSVSATNLAVNKTQHGNLTHNVNIIMVHHYLYLYWQKVIQTNA